MDINSLTSHSFVNIALGNAIEISQELVVNDPIELKAVYSRALIEHEYYKIEVGRSLAQLLGLCEQMRSSIFFLSSFRSTKKIKQEKINRASYIKYNIENYLIRTQSLLDRVLILVSAVFHLGLDPRDCKISLITRTVHVDVTSIPVLLKRLRKILEKYREDRNIVIHHESFQEEDLRKLELLYLVMNNSKDHDIRENDKYTFHARILARDYVKNKKIEFEEFNNIIFNELNELFNSLEPIYIKRKIALEGKEE